MGLYDSILDTTSPQINSFGEANAEGYGQLIYPSDLFSSSGDYANSFTAFFMSFKQGTKLDDIEKSAVSKTEAMGGYSTKGSDTVTNMGELSKGEQKTETERQISGALAGGAVGSFIGSLIGEIPTIGKYGNLVKTGGTVLIGGLGGYGAGKAEGKTGMLGLSSDRVTQKACICLPTPSIVTNYDIEWSEESNKLLGGLLAGGASFANVFKQGGSGVTDIAENILKNGGAAVTAMALSTPMFGTTLSLLGQQAANPRKEQLFKGVGMREFSFTYVFAPRSEAEAKNVESIIQMFKYHAHPTEKKLNTGVETSGFLLNYPSEFDIVHYYMDSYGNTGRNKHLPKIATSVLKRVSVDYTGGNDNYTFFDNGMPSIIKLDLTFVEIAMLVGDDIATGF